MKRVFGTIEAIFDASYIAAVLSISILLLIGESAKLSRTLAGLMGLVLVIGDAFHLIPRIMVIKTGREEHLRKSLGTGKQITSITMTLFYLLLWQIGLLIFEPAATHLLSITFYLLAFVRIIICLLPQNKWQERYPPIFWGILRNIPFFIQGALAAGLYFQNRSAFSGLGLMWLAIILSFLFYLPVVIWANKHPKIGMLMLPKTCMYVWMMIMCLSL